MTISLTSDKITKCITTARQLIASHRHKIRQVAVLIGIMIAYAPANGQAHIKSLEIDKKRRALARCNGNFERLMSISPEGLDDIHWWLHHVQHTPNPIRTGEPNTTVTTDASLEGWGAHSQYQTVGGH